MLSLVHDCVFPCRRTPNIHNIAMLVYMLFIFKRAPNMSYINYDLVLQHRLYITYEQSTQKTKHVLSIALLKTERDQEQAFAQMSLILYVQPVSKHTQILSKPFHNKHNERVQSNKKSIVIRPANTIQLLHKTSQNLIDNGARIKQEQTWDSILIAFCMICASGRS